MPQNQPPYNFFNNELRLIINKVITKKATDEERAFLDRYYAYFEKGPDITANWDDEEKAVLKNIIRKNISRDIEKRRSFFYTLAHNRWIVAAAVVLLAVLTSVTIYLSNHGTTKTEGPSVAVSPGSNKAVLTLADGSTLLLDSNQNPHLASQNQVDILLDSGHLAYKGSSDKTLFNTIATPRGGFFRLTLADGTGVWLNAQSSLHYPVAFNDDERKVTLSGEAYFEVAKNSKPFKVLVENVEEIEVVGTHFNINAYSTGAAQTTLLEGRLKVAPVVNNVPAASKARLLMPDQQAVVSGADVKVNSNVDLSEVMAWKQGQFYFENARLTTILTEFSRWYDVDIEYQCSEEVKSRHFLLIANRATPLNEALKLLKASDVTFVVAGKKIIIK